MLLFSEVLQTMTVGSSGGGGSGSWRCNGCLGTRISSSSVGGYLSAIAAAVATEEEADGVGGRGVVAVDSSCSVFQICPSICRIFSLCLRSQLRPFLSLPKLVHSPQSDETPLLLSSRHSIF